jgi:hypothetical protein
MDVVFIGFGYMLTDNLPKGGNGLREVLDHAVGHMEGIGF